MSAILREASRELASIVNPETIASMQESHRKEMSDLRDQLRKAKQQNIDVDDCLLSAVVTLDDGETYTLHQLWEDAWTETFKRTRPRCPKCPPSADIHDAEAHS